MRFKSFSVSLAILLLTALVLPLITIAKPLEPNPDTGWPEGMIWGTRLTIENSAKTDMSSYSTWWGAKTGSEYAAPWPGYPPGATSYVGIWILKEGARKGMVVENQAPPPQSYSWVVQAESDTAGDGGWLSCELENETHEFVPHDFSVVLENVDAGIHINVRENDNVHVTLPLSANLYVDNAVDENVTPSSQKNEVGGNLIYTVSVANTGRYADNYALDVSDTLGWSYSISPDNLALNPGESGSATLTVTIDSAGIDNITVRADGDYASDSVEVKGIVPPSVEVSISPSKDNALPGGGLTYTITIKNTGYENDNYILTVDDTENWTLGLSDNLVDNNRLEDVASGENKNVTLTVTIPENAIGYTEDNITVIATSQIDNTVSDNASCIAHVIAIIENVEVVISPPSQENVNGGTLTYIVTVKNLGNVPENYKLEKGDNAGWGLTLVENLYVPENDNRQTTLKVNIPAIENGGTWDNIWVIAISKNENIWDNKSCLAHVMIIENVEVTIEPSYQENVSGGNLTYIVMIKNTGNVQDNYDLTVSDNENWGTENLKFDDNRFENVPPRENRTTMLRVRIPDNIMPCTLDNIIVTVTSQADPMVSDNASCIAHVAIVRDVEVTVSPDGGGAKPGENVTFVVSVRNSGNVADNYVLTVSDNENWALMLADNLLENVQPQETIEIVLGVAILENAEIGTEDNITITATSQENAEVSKSTHCVVLAVKEVYNLDLQKGWNLVGFYLSSKVTTPGNLFGGIEHYVWYLRPGWRRLDDSDPFELGVGYWVWLENATTVKVPGWLVDNHTLDLIAGWNLVSVPVTSDNTTPENLFSGIEHYVWYLDVTWKLLGDSEPFELGVGYWVWLDQNKTVTVPL